MNVRNFLELCDNLSGIDLFGTLAQAPPWPEDSPTAALVRSAVASGRHAIPDKYVEAFIAPLRKHLPKLVQAGKEDPADLEILAGAVYQHADNYDLTPQLRRFLAVVSDVFRSFLDKEKRAAVQVPLREALPPLATFKHKGDRGPFTIPVDLVKQKTGGSVGVVTLPATYADHPVLWASLAHETGGHDVVHADRGLLGELQGGVGKALAKTSVPGLSRKKLAVLWAYWMDEAVADVYGILNVGPTFGSIMAAHHAARRNRPEGGGLGIPKVSMWSVRTSEGTLNVHPTEILRIHLAIGVVETLRGLKPAKRKAYIAHLKRLATLCASGNLVVIAGPAPNGRNKAVIDARVPLGKMQQAARKVGKYIATVKLKALGGHSIQRIETWNDADEARARAVRRALARGKPIAALKHGGRVIDDAQLLAGATMYLLDHPDQYRRVTDKLADALDHSFKTDPIWGTPRAGSVAIARAPSTSRLKPVRARTHRRKPRTDGPRAASPRK